MLGSSVDDLNHEKLGKKQQLFLSLYGVVPHGRQALDELVGALYKELLQ